MKGAERKPDKKEILEETTFLRLFIDTGSDDSELSERAHQLLESMFPTEDFDTHVDFITEYVDPQLYAAEEKGLVRPHTFSARNRSTILIPTLVGYELGEDDHTDMFSMEVTMCLMRFGLNHRYDGKTDESGGNQLEKWVKDKMKYGVRLRSEADNRKDPFSDFLDTLDF